jgi:hypothetical protein
VLLGQYQRKQLLLSSQPSSQGFGGFSLGAPSQEPPVPPPALAIPANPVSQQSSPSPTPHAKRPRGHFASASNASAAPGGDLTNFAGRMGSEEQPGTSGAPAAGVKPLER